MLNARSGERTGVIVRRRDPIAVDVEATAEMVAGGLFRLTVKIVNSSVPGAVDPSSGDSSLTSMASTHIILGASGGQFVSLFDTPACYQEFTDTLHNDGTWPVLAGLEGQRSMMLASPIILYDYPQVAAESPGDLFDATEIDEILSLRIMTLTDQEREQAAALDSRVRDLLSRTHSLSDQQLGNLHGTVRGLRPVNTSG